MKLENTLSTFLLGAWLFLGLSSLGYLLSKAVIDFKEYDRSVTVKGYRNVNFQPMLLFGPLFLLRQVMTLMLSTVLLTATLRK